MSTKALRLRLRRLFRMQKKQVVTIGEQADAHFEQNFLKRLAHLGRVRRFMAGWLLLIVLLIVGIGVQFYYLTGQYQALRPVAGGMYNEGMVGSLSNMNPIYAEGLADRTVARLVYSGLFALDGDELVPDLATKWSRDEPGRVYTVELRKDVKWHDGVPVTAHDVVFTYDTIKHPDSLSPLRDSWAGVKVTAKDDYTVVFSLDTTLAAFPYYLTNGIIPSHVFKGIVPAQLRSSPQNTMNLVGSGPFKWRAIEIQDLAPGVRQAHVLLDRYDDYHAGAAKIDTFGIRVFSDEQQLVEAYQRRELQAIVGLQALPADLANEKNLIVHSLPQTAQTMVFFKTTADILKEQTVRQALVRGTDNTAVTAALGYHPRPVDKPILAGQVGFDSAAGQLSYDVAAAKKLLDDAGWIPGSDGVRVKDDQKLTFTLRADNSADAATVSRILQEQWRQIGVSLAVELQESDQFATTVSTHDYDALLHGVSIGPDPDVYVYWHGSQADTSQGSRLNFSEYKSATANEALASARSRVDNALRAAKYKPFLEAWRSDAPAVALYQARVMYVTRDIVYGFEPSVVSSASDRLLNVHEWMIRRAHVNKVD